MAKKLLLILIILLVISGFAFSQESHEEEANNTISVLFTILGTEASYERSFNRYFSVLADVSYTTLFIVNELTASGKGRWYPFGRTFYMEMGLGFGYANAATGAIAALLFPILLLIPDFDISRTDYIYGFLIQTGMGWKIDIGKPGGFVLPVSLQLDFMPAHGFVWPFIRIGVGYAF